MTLLERLAVLRAAEALARGRAFPKKIGSVDLTPELLERARRVAAERRANGFAEGYGGPS